MLIAGAKKHAKEILEVLHHLNLLKDLCFFDDMSGDLPQQFYGKFHIVRSLDEAQKIFVHNPDFILGTGSPESRKILAGKLSARGGLMKSVIAHTALIGNYDVVLNTGLNIMNNVMVSNSTVIGEGTLLNAFACVHHDVVIGDYCEISPRASLLGGCLIGSYTSVGAGAVILPGIQLGHNVIIGAGAVVTKDIPPDCLALGVPAKVVKTLPPCGFLRA